ncbi:MAG TPA: GNAT family acetyltransferase [Caproicibacter sp.]|nr:GNAT family acetyltransferase [Caproicibacter sp.]
MSKIIGVTPNDDFTILISFDSGNKILLNMRNQIRSLPFCGLQDIQKFKKVHFEDKAVFWEEEHTACPARLTVDNILFTIRDG